MNSTQTTKVQVDDQRRVIEKKKEISFGLEKPLNVKWTGNPVVGEYITISFAHSMSKSPVEIVISKLIGKSLTVPKNALVVNHRKDVPELIKDAGDPLKDKHKRIVRLMRMEKLLELKFVKKVGDTYLVEKLASAALEGVDVEDYYERSSILFKEDRLRAEEAHVKGEEQKPFRFRKKFVYKKSLEDFLTVDEKALKAVLAGVYTEPAFVKKVEQATEDRHETLINGTDPQKVLVLGVQDFEEHPMSVLTAEIGREMFKFLTGVVKVPPTPEVKALKAENDTLKKKVEEHGRDLKQVHDYYQDKDVVLAGKQAQIVRLQEEVAELQRQVSSLEEEEEEEAT